LDESEAGQKFGSMEKDLSHWVEKFEERSLEITKIFFVCGNNLFFFRLKQFLTGEKSQLGTQTMNGNSSSDEDDGEEEEEDEILDVEEIGNYIKKSKSDNSKNTPKEMVSDTIRKSLTKQVTNI